MSFIKNIKKKEREIFKKIRAQSTSFERERVKHNIERYINSLDKKEWADKYFAIYWPLQDEVDLTDFKKKYPLALPKCESNRIINFYLWDETPLIKDKEGIPSPFKTKLLNHKKIFCIFLPCISVDPKLYRLGYGGGYYDKLRAIKEWRLIPCIGVLTERCVSKNFLTKADWDIPLDGYITNNRILI